jgi:hypothetical protein
MNPNKIYRIYREVPKTTAIAEYAALGLRSPSLDSALRASLRLSKIAPGDFVATLTPTYIISTPCKTV